jgi:hypothetical protein
VNWSITKFLNFEREIKGPKRDFYGSSRGTKKYNFKFFDNSDLGIYIRRGILFINEGFAFISKAEKFFILSADKENIKINIIVNRNIILFFGLMLKIFIILEDIVAVDFAF